MYSLSTSPLTPARSIPCLLLPTLSLFLFSFSKRWSTKSNLYCQYYSQWPECSSSWNICELLSRPRCLHVVGYGSACSNSDRLQVHCSRCLGSFTFSQLKHLAEGARARTRKPFGMLLMEKRVLGGVVTMELCH